MDTIGIFYTKKQAHSIKKEATNMTMRESVSDDWQRQLAEWKQKAEALRDPKKRWTALLLIARVERDFTEIFRG